MKTLAIFLVLVLGAFAKPERTRYFDEDQIAKLRNHKPTGAPVDFDCAAREVAFSYAKKIQPWKTNFEDVWDALQLTTLCNQTKPSFTRVEVEKFPRVEAPSANTFYVATNGNDNNQGSITSPFASLPRAIRAARGANGNSTIYMRAGEYFLSETIRLTTDDNQLTITNYQNEAVTLSGGRLVNANWKPYKQQTPAWKLYPGMNNVMFLVDTYSDAEGIRFLGTFKTPQECQQAAMNYKGTPMQSFTFHGLNINNSYAGQCFGGIDYRWGPEYQEHVTSGRLTGFNIYVADVSGQGFREITGLQQRNGGKRASRVRYPHADTETSHFPYGWMMETASYMPGKKYPPAQTELILTPIRSDNLEFQLYSQGLGGPCSIFTPPTSYWCSANSSGGAATIFETPSGIVYEPWTFVDYPAPATPSKGIMQMFHPYHWASWMYQIDDITPASQSITWSYGGFQGARGSGSGNGNGGEWYIENIFEYLDTQNEFYYDDENQLLYYYYNGTSAPPSDFRLVATQLKTLIDIRGDRDDPVMNITIQGIKFTAAAYTYMDPHGVPSGGDWAMQRIAAVQCEGCESFKIIGCRFERLDGNGLLLSGYNRHTEINFSEFAWLGDSAIVLWGYSRGVDGSDGNQPRFTSISGNVMREMGIFEKQSSGIFQAIACQTSISSNLIFNGPRALVNFNDGFGGGNEIQRNLLFNPNRETSDQGPFNSWDRLPFLTDVNGGVLSFRPIYNNIHDNFFICNYGSNMCIDNDDGSSYYNNHHNVEIYGGHKSDYGGHNKFTFNSIQLYAQDYEDGLCGWFNAVVPDFVDGYFSNICVQGPVVPYLILDDCNVNNPNAAVMPQIMDNSVYNADGNLTIDCGGTILSIQDFQNLGFDQGTQAYPMPTVAQMMSWVKELLEL